MDREEILNKLDKIGITGQKAEKLADIIEQEAELEGTAPSKILESLRDNAKSVISDLSLDMFSFVDEPAQPSSFVMVKEDNSWKKTGELLKDKNLDDDWDTIYAPVMVPGVKDKDGDVIPHHLVKEEAHNFLEEEKIEDIDSDHNLITGKGKLVESWILKEAKTYKDLDGEKLELPEGTWMAGVKPKKSVKNKIKNGDIKGFSIYGDAEKIELKRFSKFSDISEIKKLTKDLNEKLGKLEKKDNLPDDNLNEEKNANEDDNMDDEIKDKLDAINKNLKKMLEKQEQEQQEQTEEEPTEEKQDEALSDRRELAQLVADEYDVAVGEALEMLERLEEKETHDDMDEDEEDEDKEKEKQAKYKKQSEEGTREELIKTDSTPELSYEKKIRG